MSTSKSYQPRPTAAIPTGATSIERHSTRSPRVDPVKEAFEATFGGYVPADWTLDAECTRPDYDPSAFYPTSGGGHSKATKSALAACAACIVRERCLEDAIAYEVGDIGGEDVRPEVHGIRGGMIEKERRKLVQKIRVDREAEVKKKVVAEYAAGELVEDIAAKYGVSVNSPHRWAREAGLDVRHRDGGHGNGRPDSRRNRSNQQAVEAEMEGGAA